MSAATDAKRYAMAKGALRRLVEVGEAGATGVDLFGEEWDLERGRSWARRLTAKLVSIGLVHESRPGGMAAPYRFRALSRLGAVSRDDTALGTLMFGSDADLVTAAATSPGDPAEGEEPEADEEEVGPYPPPERVEAVRVALERLCARTPTSLEDGATGPDLFGPEWDPPRGNWRYHVMRRLVRAGLVQATRPHGRRQFYTASGGLAVIRTDAQVAHLLNAVKSDNDGWEPIRTETESDPPAAKATASPGTPSVQPEDAEPTDRELLEGLLVLAKAIADGQAALVQQFGALRRELQELHALWK